MSIKQDWGNSRCLSLQECQSLLSLLKSVLPKPISRLVPDLLIPPILGWVSSTKSVHWRGSREGGSSEQGNQPCLPCRLPRCAQPQPGYSRIWSQHTSSQHVMANFPKQQFPLFLFAVYCFLIWGTGIHDWIGNVVSISLWRIGVGFFPFRLVWAWAHLPLDNSRAAQLSCDPHTRAVMQHSLSSLLKDQFSLRRAAKCWLGLNQANSPLITKWVSKRRRLPECWWFTFSHLMHQE